MSKTTTTTRRLSQACPLFLGASLVLCDVLQLAARHRRCPATEAATTALVVTTRAAVDCCGPGHVYPPLGPTGTEDGQGGREVRVEPHGEVPEEPPSPLPSQPELFSLYHEELGGRRPASLAELPGGRKSGSSGTPWSSLPTLLPWYRTSTYQCRRRWNRWWTSSSSSTRSHLSSRSSQCPRSHRTPSRSVRLLGRSWWNSWWKCRLP